MAIISGSMPSSAASSSFRFAASASCFLASFRCFRASFSASSSSCIRESRASYSSPAESFGWSRFRFSSWNLFFTCSLFDRSVRMDIPSSRWCCLPLTWSR